MAYMVYDRTDSETWQVWAGCLGCYNAGRLIGEWLPALDPDTDAAGLTASGHCVRCGSDEWQCLDTELPLINGEPGLGEAAGHATGLAEALDRLADRGLDHCADAFVEYAADLGATDGFTDLAETFMDRTLSTVTDDDGPAGLAEALAESEIYQESELPAWARGQYWAVLQGMAASWINGGVAHAYRNGSDGFVWLTD